MRHLPIHLQWRIFRDHSGPDGSYSSSISSSSLPISLILIPFLNSQCSLISLLWSYSLLSSFSFHSHCFHFSLLGLSFSLFFSTSPWLWLSLWLLAALGFTPIAVLGPSSLLTTVLQLGFWPGPPLLFRPSASAYSKGERMSFNCLISCVFLLNLIWVSIGHHWTFCIDLLWVVDLCLHLSFMICNNSRFLNFSLFYQVGL